MATEPGWPTAVRRYRLIRPAEGKQAERVLATFVGYVIEVIAGETTRSPRHTCGKVDNEPGYALRFPRMLRFRFDRRPEDATTEAEAVALYRTRTQPAKAAHLLSREA